jgi:isopenicillin N synthase-like dioxygenase
VPASEALSRQFFDQSEREKMRIAMFRAVRAWCGYFPVGGELTSGKPDRKEGLYFGAELAADRPAVLAGKPLHGPNLFPDMPHFREVVLRYLDSLTQLGRALVSGISLSLGLNQMIYKSAIWPIRSFCFASLTIHRGGDRRHAEGC